MRNQKGFTIVELAVVLAALSILVVASTFAISAWQKRVAQNAIQSDLNSLSAAMENTRNFSGGYPTTVPSTFIASKNVVITPKNMTGGAVYCIEGSSAVASGIVYSISNTSHVPVPSSCP